MHPIPVSSAIIRETIFDPMVHAELGYVWIAEISIASELSAPCLKRWNPLIFA
jgi:hypothetical protein